MPLVPIQWLIAAFAAFAVARSWQAYRTGGLDRRKLFLWAAFWTSVIVVILTPQTTSFLAAILGVGRGADLILYLSTVVLFYGLFQLSRRADRLDRQLTDLVRELALRDAAPSAREDVDPHR